MTPHIVNALSQMRDGGNITFEKGEYHFFEQGAVCEKFAPSNNATGVKKIAFPIIGINNITIDGGGSTFVFHGAVSPFIASKSCNITIKNAVLTTHLPPYVLMKITESNDDGFSADYIDCGIPFETHNGALIFKTDRGDISTADKNLSLHATNRLAIQYLFTEKCPASRENLATTYIDCNAKKHGNSIEFRYSEDKNASRSVYSVGETVSINLEENRYRDVFFLEDSEDIKLSGISIIRGGGMGVIAQLCRNIEIEKITVKPTNGELITTTADIIHLINCSGKVSIHHCEFESSLDDACNIHGTYTYVSGSGQNYIDVRYGHPQQDFLDLYKKGDTLTVINNDTLEQVANISVSSCEFTDDTGLAMRIYTESALPQEIGKNFLVESAQRMPDIHIYSNQSANIPNWRLSGAGNIVVEDNIYTDCFCPVYSYDLAKYWFESGRIKNLTVRNNIFRKARFDKGFIVTGVSGFDGPNTPEIHENITVENNTFEDFCGEPASIFGFKNIIYRNNKVKK